MDMEIVYRHLTQTYLHLWLHALKGIVQMEMAAVLVKLKYQFLLQFAQVDIKMMATVTVLLHLNLLCVILDLLVMELEAVFQLSFQPHLLVQVIISLMEKETVFQIRIQK
jgi:hypothetical protein